MKRVQIALFGVLLATPALFAQTPTWAEQIHKAKTGVYPPAMERQLSEQRKVTEEASRVQLGELFSMLDLNRDGVISAQEWRLATQAGSGADPAANR
jgi:EF hand